MSYVTGVSYSTSAHPGARIGYKMRDTCFIYQNVGGGEGSGHVYMFVLNLLVLMSLQTDLPQLQFVDFFGFKTTAQEGAL